MRSLALLVVLLMIAPAIRWVGETPGDDGTGERGAEVIAGHPGDRTVGPGRVVGTQAPPGRDGGGHSTDRSPAMPDDPGRSGPPASDGERDRGGAPEPVYLRRGNPGTGIDFRGPGLYIIQFEPGADALPRLERAGAVLYDRIPRHARVAWLESVPGTEGIVRLFPLTPEIKVLSTGPVCRIAPTDLVRTSADLAGLGIDADRVGPYLRAGLTPAQVRAVAALPTVRYIERWPMAHALMDVAPGIVDPVDLRHRHALNGSGEIVAVADMGLDTGVLNASLHPDLRGKVIAIIDRTGDGPDDDDNHGTHVAGTIVGSGAGSNGTFVGIAPGARLLYQAVADDSGSFTGVSDIEGLLQEAYDRGARIHSDSWGYDDRDYTSDSADLDGFVRDNDLMLVVLAAGNDGIDDDGDGEIDPGSIISPANAKNGIAVGASESLRSGGGYANLSYGDVWPSDYPAEPIRSDLTSNDTGGMAAFSSRGYTTDGRLKPDIVAPGTNIISTRSSVGTDSLWGIYDARYLYSGGTSMATPIVSGAAAVLRQYLRIQGTEPTASLMKAILIVTADDMDGQYASGGAAEPIPNIHEGWGRLNLSRALDLRSRELAYVNHGPTLRTGQYINYSIPCVGGDDLRITLTWTDEPGSPLASVALVNDLDLTVVAPDGTVYKGNIFSGGHSVTGNGNADPDWDTDGDGYDDRNNVECVYIDMPGNGTWTVQVSARDADGGQDFSLAILGRTGPDFSTANLTLDAKSVLGSPVNVTVDVRNVGFLPNLTGRLELGPERGNLTFTPSDLVDAPNGTLALAVGPGGRIRVITFDGAWNASGAGGDLRAVAFHPDGRYALIAGDQGLFRWTPSSGVMRVADGDLRDVAFLPNGTAIAVGNGTVVTYPGARRVILDDPCDSSAGWSTGGTKDVWERGAPHASQAFPGNHSPADVWGTDLNASTPTNANMWLRRDVDLTGYENPVLTFWHYRDFEDGYDGGVIEVLGASQWKTVVPEGGYDGYVEALGGPGFHSLRGWSRESVFLDDYAGGLVSIRFRFASDGSINRAGWFIDDARIVDWNASERSVGDDLERVATNGTGALAAGVSRLVSIPSMDVLKPDGLDPAGLWWDGAWYVVDRNGSILRLDGSLTRVAGTGNVSDVERFEGGWIAAEDGVYRYNGTLHRFADVTVDIIAPDHRLEHLAVIGDRLYDLSRELASPVVELSVDGHVIGRTVSTGNVTFRWTPAIAGVVTLIATVNPPGPRRIPEADLSDNTFMLDIVVRTQKRFVLVVDDDGGRDDEAAAVELLDTCYVHNASNGTITAAVMSDFDAVVWVVGDEYSEALNASERDVIGAYLDDGGRLFIYGQDIALAAVRDEWTGWMSAYLNADVVAHSTDAAWMNGTDLYEGISTATDDQRPSALSPVGSARAGMTYPDGNASAILYAAAYRTVYWGFGLHRIADVDVRGDALNRTISFLVDGDPPALIEDRSPANATTGDPFPLEVVLSDDTGVRTAVGVYDLGLGPAVVPLTRNITRWTGNISVPPDATGLRLLFWFEDFSGNTNASAWRNVTVLDDDPPAISLDAYSLRTGQNGTVILNITDNVALEDAWIVYRFLPDGTPANATVDGNVDLPVPVNATALNATVFAIDAAGNRATVPLGDLAVVDTIPPEREVDLTVDTYDPGSNVTFRARFIDNVGVVGGIVRVECGNGTASYNLTPEGDGILSAVVNLGGYCGPVNYTFVPEDAWGNSRSMEMHTMLPLDTSPPEIALSGLGPVGTGDALEVRIVVTDNVGVGSVVASATFDAGNATVGLLPDNGTYAGTLTVPVDARHMDLRVNASDVSGLWNDTLLASVDVNDTRGPVVTISAGTPLAGTNLTVAYEIVDNRDLEGGWLSYAFDGGAPVNMQIAGTGASPSVNGTMTVAVPADAMTLVLNLTATDGSGNAGYRRLVLDVSDRTRPVITVSSGATYTGGRYRLEFNVSDPGGVSGGYVRYTDDGGGGNESFSGAGIHVLDLLGVRGTLHITIVAEDDQGNTATVVLVVRERRSSESGVDLQTILLVVASVLGGLFIAILLLSSRRRALAYECPICGAALEEDDEECPLCHAVIDWGDGGGRR